MWAPQILPRKYYYSMSLRSSETFVIEATDRKTHNETLINRVKEVHYNTIVMMKPTVAGGGKVQLLGLRERCEGRFN
jgi:hypothetical protein